MLDEIKKQHDKPRGMLVFFVAEFALAYMFASLAVDRGNLWWYLLMLVFFIGSLKNLFKLFGTISHGRNKTS